MVTPMPKTTTYVTVNAQMIPANPNQRSPTSTIGMNSTPWATDMTIAGTERPVPGTATS